MSNHFVVPVSTGFELDVTQYQLLIHIQAMTAFGSIGILTLICGFTIADFNKTGSRGLSQTVSISQGILLKLSASTFNLPLR